MNVKQITHGSMTIALLILIMIMDRMFAHTLLALLPIVCPLPLIIYSYRFPIKASVFVALAAILVSFLFSELYFWVLFICYIILGLGIGWSLQRFENDKLTIIIASIINFFSYILLFIFFKNIVSVEFEMLIKSFADKFSESGLSRVLITKLVYSVYVYSCIIEAYLATFFAKMLISYFNSERLTFKTWNSIKFPKWSILALFIGFLVGDLFSQYSLLVLMFSQFCFCFLVLIGHLWLVSFPKLKGFAFLSILIFFLTIPINSPLHIGMAILYAIGIDIGDIYGKFIR